MGKHVSKKKTMFGEMANETIVTTEKEYTDTPTVTDTPTPIEKPKESKSTGTRTPTDTPKYAPAHLPTVGNGERKTERLQLVVKPSTKSRLAKYAQDHGTSSNEVVQRLLDDLLDDAGY